MGMCRKSWQEPTALRYGFLAPLTMLQSANCLHAAPAASSLCLAQPRHTDSRGNGAGGGVHRILTSCWVGRRGLPSRASPAWGDRGHLPIALPGSRTGLSRAAVTAMQPLLRPSVSQSPSWNSPGCDLTSRYWFFGPKGVEVVTPQQISVARCPSPAPRTAPRPPVPPQRCRFLPLGVFFPPSCPSPAPRGGGDPRSHLRFCSNLSCYCSPPHTHPPGFG